MRLKTFNAPTMADAMRMIREALGEDAIIVSTQRGDGGRGVRVTAALDAEDTDYGHASPADYEELDPIDVVTEAFSRHNLPPAIGDRLIRSASAIQSEDPVIVLAGALDAYFGFAPLPDRAQRRPIMLVGPPGVGKTVSVAKIATRQVIARRAVHVVTTDTVRAGGFDQLAAFTRVLKLELRSADTPEELVAACATAPAPALTLIDCAGVNPYDRAEMARLKALAKAVQAEPILVAAAGGDPLDAADLAEVFKSVGVSRLVVTQLDIARRLGGILALASSGQLTFSGASASPKVAEPLAAINPVSLARLLLPDVGGREARAGSRAYG